jgi:hypothetical protein
MLASDATASYPEIAATLDMIGPTRARAFERLRRDITR